MKLNEEWDKGMFGVKVKGEYITGPTKLLTDLIEKNNYPLQTFSVKDLFETSGWHSLDDIIVSDDGKMVHLTDLSKDKRDEHLGKLEQHLMNADLSKPLIVYSENKKIKVIDVHHRLEKAHIENKQTLQGYQIPKKDLLTLK